MVVLFVDIGGIVVSSLFNISFHSFNEKSVISGGLWFATFATFFTYDNQTFRVYVSLRVALRCATFMP